MHIFVFPLLIVTFANIAFAQNEEQGVFNLHQNPLEPGQAPVYDQRLAPSKDASGIILPQENSDLPLEAAVVFDEKKKKMPISRDFIFGFVSGSILMAFVSFFMLKFGKKSSDLSQVSKVST